MDVISPEFALQLFTRDQRAAALDEGCKHFGRLRLEAHTNALA